MGLTLRWGLGVGLALAIIDAVSAEIRQAVGGTDLTAAIELADLAANLTLYGLAGFRVARAAGAMRAGLEAAVLAGVLVGCSGVAYNLVRGEAPLAVDAVALVAWNVVLGSLAGAMGAWGGTARRPAPPPSR